MKICVLGLTHLGTVTAICSANTHQVTAYDKREVVVFEAEMGRLPIFEEGLGTFWGHNYLDGRLKFTSDPKKACEEVDLLWVCLDTPVGEDNVGRPEEVLDEVRVLMRYLKPSGIVLLSSQLPVGTCAKMEKEFPAHYWAVSPENLQLGKAVKCFLEPERVVVGFKWCEEYGERIKAAFPSSANVFIWTSPETAEMVKHALNCHLSMSIAFANEIGRVCEKVGADVRTVEKALKSDVRIGPNARLQAGGAYEGSSLAREVSNVTRIGAEHGCDLKLIPAIAISNDTHRAWTFNKVTSLFTGQPKLKIALLGLTFKAGTHTLNRSGAVDLARKLHAAGYKVSAYDPSNPVLPEVLQFIELATSVEQAVFEADAAVLCTPWPEFKKVDWERAVVRGMRNRVLVDPNGFLVDTLKGIDITHHTVGSSINQLIRPGL
jgi:UDPglucose 6-dehydrogenase